MAQPDIALERRTPIRQEVHVRENAGSDQPSLFASLRATVGGPDFASILRLASNFAKASMDRSEDRRKLPPSPASRDSARQVGAAEAGVSLPVNKILK